MIYLSSIDLLAELPLAQDFFAASSVNPQKVNRPALINLGNRVKYASGQDPFEPHVGFDHIVLCSMFHLPSPDKKWVLSGVKYRSRAGRT